MLLHAFFLFIRRGCHRVPFVALLFTVATLIAATPALAQPQPGDIFREFTFNPGKTLGAHFGELDPDCPRLKDPNFGMRNMKPHVPRTITLDLDHAVRAELSVEYWGGHIGTGGQKFRINEHDWLDIPQPAGTPTNPVCYQRTLLGNNAVAIPLEQLKQGENVVQFAAGPQVKYSFKWGFYWIYDFTIRVYYDAKKPHPTGRVTSPAAAATLGDRPALAAEASGETSPVRRVDFIGFYDDFDWAGNGLFRQWHWQTIHGVMQRQLGSAAAAPWRATWQNEWVPDQDVAMQIAAKITDATGVSFITPAVEGLKLHRTGRVVKMYRPAKVPESFQARAKKKAGCIIPVTDDLAGARAARMVVATWSGSNDDNSVHELRLNGERLANRFGVMHNYSVNALDVPLSRLKRGDNEVTIYSEFDGHALEINWPGPVLLIESAK